MDVERIPSWWFQRFFFFIRTWGRFPFWLIDIFQLGWNHQLDTFVRCLHFFFRKHMAGTCNVLQGAFAAQNLCFWLPASDDRRGSQPSAGITKHFHEFPHDPQDECTVYICYIIFAYMYLYLPTFYHRSKPIVGKYSGPINPMGLEFVIYLFPGEWIGGKLAGMVRPEGMKKQLEDLVVLW